MNITELKAKQEMVNALSAVFAEHIGNVESLSYEVFINEENGWTQEYLVFHFVGGAILARNCNWNSKSAVVEEVAKYMNGGYYDEVDNYLAYERKAADPASGLKKL